MNKNIEKAYSVSQVNQYIKNMFLSDYALNKIYIKGEISNCKYHTSGHIYFTIKDSKSQISAVMFAGQRAGLQFRLQEGQSVIVLGSIQVYERDGKYQMYAREILLDGAGQLYEKFQQLKNDLEEEGLFAPEYKQPIPVYAKTVGIVTAKTGAAIQDIMNISARRNPFVQLVLYPAKVQGEGAAVSIVQGIKRLDSMGLDVLIVGRGGGSLEDLWAFNEEMVARAIFECNTPVISAVGHETDVTIADYAADLRAPTPSAAAELAVCNIADVLFSLQEYEKNLQQNMQYKIQRYRTVLENKKLKIEHNSPFYQIQQKKQYLMHAEEKLQSFMENQLKNKKHALAIYIEKMKALSPLEKLSQGYGYIQAEEKQLKTIENVTVGDTIHISIIDGEMDAKVTKLEKIKRK